MDSSNIIKLANELSCAISVAKQALDKYKTYDKAKDAVLMADRSCETCINDCTLADISGKCLKWDNEKI